MQPGEVFPGVFRVDLCYYLANARALFENGNGLFHGDPFSRSFTSPRIYSHLELVIIERERDPRRSLGARATTQSVSSPARSLTQDSKGRLLAGKPPGVALRSAPASLRARLAFYSSRFTWRSRA